MFPSLHLDTLRDPLIEKLIDKPPHTYLSLLGVVAKVQVGG
jgi:hypothetical protein